jgi:hypothetical protein
MTIRKSGYPNITIDDLQWTHRGRTMGVELTEFDGLRFCLVVELVDGKWNSPVGEMLQTCSDADIAAAGGPVGWIKTTFLTWLNDTLKVAFPASSAPTTSLPPFEQVDALLAKTVRLVAQPDGTLKAVV